MDKRYQVFVSSTYADLQEERQQVMQALLKLDCIPSGMEPFQAANDDQCTLIRRVIDDCDYYMVIVAGRYGSTGPDGLSSTEMEYRYALEKGKPIIGFLNKDPGAIPAARRETTEDGQRKLGTFRQLVRKKMCRYWDSPANLESQVSRSLAKLIKNNPAVGWVRGNPVMDATAAEEILRLRKRIQVLESGLEKARPKAPEGIEHLSSAAEEVQSWFKDLSEGRKDFWSAVHKKYKRRDISKEKVMALVDFGLRSTRGSYKRMAAKLRLKNKDYRRFMDFLRRSECLLDFRPYRKLAATSES